MSHSKCYKSVSSSYNILAVHDLKMSHGTLCLSPLLPQIFVHIEWVFLTRLFNTWHDFLKMSFRIFSELHGITVKNYVRNDDRENDRTDELKYRHPSKHLCRHICESVLAFVCVRKIGWQHVCHCSRTLLLLSGTADGCLSNASVRMPIHQLKQMLNADISCICLTLVIKHALPQAFS